LVDVLSRLIGVETVRCLEVREPGLGYFVPILLKRQRFERQRLKIELQLCD
jgi:hypothetical protein